MPHSTKKKRRAASAHSQPSRKSTSSRRNLYIIVGVVAAVIAAASGIALYYTYSTTTAGSPGTVIYANLDTSQGTIEIELFQGLVPATVNNFVSLAESGFYNNLVWHRIQAGFVIQTGDPYTRNGQGNICNSSEPDMWGTGGSGKTIPFESVPSLHNDAGYLGMASGGAGQGGTSQFYINLQNNPSLDGSYAVFGKIVNPNGLIVATKISDLPLDPNCPNTGEGGPPANPSEAMLVSVTILNSTTSTST